MEMHITLCKLIGKSLISRDQAEALSKLILEQKGSSLSIVLDFENVDFVSRSFADELVTLLNKIVQKETYSFSYSNFNEQHIQMFEAVRNTQKPTLKKRVSLPIMRFSTEKEFYNYLELI